MHVNAVATYGLLFLFYLVTYFVATFFNTAIVSCAVLRLAGGSPTLKDGFQEAVARLPLIRRVGFAVGDCGSGVANRRSASEKIDQMVPGLLGMTWTVVTFLVVPVLVVERRGPFQALKESASLLRKTWGEQLVGSFSFGLIGFVFALPAVAFVVLGLFSGSALLGIACIGLALIYVLALSVVQSALQSIFQAAVYLYAHNNGTAYGRIFRRRLGGSSPQQVKTDLGRPRRARLFV